MCHSPPSCAGDTPGTARGPRTFAFEIYDPPGTLVPPHVHPAQDEFIFVHDGVLEVELDGERHAAPAGSLVKTPRGIPHGYYNTSDEPTRCLFWVTPAGKLKELFDQLHEMTDVEEVVRVSPSTTSSSSLRARSDRSRR